MSKYEERVKQRAEEMLLIAEPGLATGKHSIGGRRYALQLIEERIAKYTPLARLSVQWEAEAFKKGFEEIYNYTEDQDFRHNITKQLIERGLIPPQTQTT